ncbi:MAG: HNH endonuclease [Nitrospirae bacterium]|nr:HNH endonuclease [Nitrospirota bacterium]
MTIPLPKRIAVNGRTTSLTNAFVSHITPQIEPTDEEIEWALGIIGQPPDRIRCAYCGGDYHYWDHFRPLVVKRRPTGYITEINNLVPCCNICSTSKGNKHWRDWIQGNAAKCPGERMPKGLKDRINRLEEFERQSKPVKIDYARLVGKKLWNKHWRNLDAVVTATQQSIKAADDIRHKVKQEIERRTSGHGLV